MKKIKIGIDLDDTLVPSVDMYIREMLKDREYPAFRGYHTIRDFTPEEEMVFYVYIRKIINRQDIKKFKPIPGAVSVIKELSKKYELYIITARTKDIKKHTRVWIAHHFPKMFKRIVFSKYKIEGQFIKTKGQLCKALGISLMVEDHYDYVLDCSKRGIKAIVFDYKNGYPWSKGKLPKGVKKAKTWKEVSEIIKKTKF